MLLSCALPLVVVAPVIAPSALLTVAEPLVEVAPVHAPSASMLFSCALPDVLPLPAAEMAGNGLLGPLSESLPFEVKALKSPLPVESQLGLSQ